MIDVQYMNNIIYSSDDEDTKNHDTMGTRHKISINTLHFSIDKRIVVFIDSYSNKLVYFDTESGEKYDKNPEWIEYFSSRKAQVYYHNIVTKETVWDTEKYWA